MSKRIGQSSHGSYIEVFDMGWLTGGDWRIMLEVAFTLSENHKIFTKMKKLGMYKQ